MAEEAGGSKVAAAKKSKRRARLAGRVLFSMSRTKDLDEVSNNMYGGDRRGWDRARCHTWVASPAVDCTMGARTALAVPAKEAYSDTYADRHESGKLA